MCIICNCPESGDKFLSAYFLSRKSMQAATAAMLVCSKEDANYDKTHKAMVRLVREWNRIEENREVGKDG